MEKNDESITSNECTDDEHEEEHDENVTIVEKPKRIMSEKQLENLKRARGLAKIKLSLKKKETIESKKKNVELKLLQKLEKNLRIDMELNELKKKITIPREPEPEPEPEPETVLLPTAVQYKKLRSKTKVKKVKKVIYVSDSDSDIESEEEIVYKKKPSVKTKTCTVVRHSRPVEDSELILKQQYNDRMAQIKREFIMNQMFPN